MTGNMNGNKQVDGEGMQVSCTLHFKGSKRLISETSTSSPGRFPREKRPGDEVGETCIKQTPSGNAVVSA